MKVSLFKKQKSDEDDDGVILMDEEDDEPEFDFEADEQAEITPTKQNNDVEDFEDLYRIAMIDVLRERLENFNLDDYVYNHKTHRKNILQRYYDFRKQYATLQALILLRRLVFSYETTTMIKSLEELKIMPLRKDDMIDIRKFNNPAFVKYLTRLDSVLRKQQHLRQIDGAITIIRVSLLRYFQRKLGGDYEVFEDPEMEDDDLMEELSEGDAQNEIVDYGDFDVEKERRANKERTLQVWRDIQEKYVGGDPDEIYKLTNDAMAYDKIVRDIQVSIENDVPFNGIAEVRELLGSAKTRTLNFQNLNALLIYMQKKKAKLDSLLKQVVSKVPKNMEDDDIVLQEIASAELAFRALASEFVQVYGDALTLYQLKKLNLNISRKDVAAAVVYDIYETYTAPQYIKKRLQKKYGDAAIEELKNADLKDITQDTKALRAFIVKLQPKVKKRADVILGKMQRVQENDMYHRMAVNAVKKQYPNIKIPKDAESERSEEE